MRRLPADTMEFIREALAGQFGRALICFSGRGGEVPGKDGTWRPVLREESKRLFREGRAEIMVCTDAASEGLNFQFCGALRERIGLFESFVGRLQPILARLPRTLSAAALAAGGESVRRELGDALERDLREAERASFDLDELLASGLDEVVRPEPLYDLNDLRRILTDPALLPPGIEVKPAGAKGFAYQAPGMDRPVRVATDPDFYEAHPEVDRTVEVSPAQFRRALARHR